MTPVETVEQPAPAYLRWLKAFLVLIVLTLIAMWVYAFGFAPRAGVNPVKDPVWTDGAQAACIDAATQLQPLIFKKKVQDTTDLQAYATNMDQAALVFDHMLDTIAALPRTSDRAVVVVPQWLADFRIWVTDLRAWTQKLHAGERAIFGVSLTDTGIPVDERINTFATENRIKECRIDRLQG
jgi:hypothetical protein